MDSAEITKIVTDKCYTLNEVVLRRIGWYSYKENTTLSIEDDRIVIKTEMPIKGVYDTLILYPNGKSEVKMEFDHDLITQTKVRYMGHMRVYNTVKEKPHNP